jgi:hypothetical protein
LAGIRLIVLNGRQISETLNDFIADNAKAIFCAKRVVSSGTYCVLRKNNAKMLCDISQSNNTLTLNDGELEKLLIKLPHTGFKCFEMSDKQIKEAINGGRELNIEDLNFSADNSVDNKNFRLITLDEKEMREILYKQTFEFAIGVFGFQTDSFSFGIQADFDGEESKLVFFLSDKPFIIDLSKLDTNKTFLTSPNAGFDYKYIDLTDGELEKLIIKT